MAIFDNLFGGGITGASEAGLAAQIAANAETARFIEQQAGIARGDISGALQPQIEAFQGGALQAQGQLDPFSTQGLSAFNLQAALSGAGGAPAQQAAFDQFTASPGQQFLREQGERALLRSSSAIGGLGGGNVRSALQQQGIGFAQQDFQNQFNRLGTLSQIGSQAAGQQADISLRAGAGLADIRGQGASALANIATGAASQRAGLPGLPNLQRDPGVLSDVGSLASGIGTGLSALGGLGSGAAALGLGGTGTAAGAGLGAAGLGAAGIGAGGAATSALGGGALATTAPGALIPGAVSTAPLGAATTAGGATGAAATGLSGFASGGSFAGLGAIGALAVPLALGAFGFPSGKANVEAIEAARQESILEPILPLIQSQIPAGVTQEEFNASRQPPQSPLQSELKSLQSSSVGDKDFEAEQISNFFQNTEVGRAQMQSFFLANPQWFNPDGSRTDFAGPLAPPLSVQRATAEELFGARAAGTLTASSALTPSTVAIEPLAPLVNINPNREPRLRR